ncbi:MAG: hypothetical protein JNM19_17430 [Chitinophagaceae bacterium]|nr:hypothetical protein [Chitinophagaceae bacterium]
MKALKNIHLPIVFLLLLVCNSSRAQPSKDSLVNYPITSIDVASLVGYWQTTDSLKTKIQFIDSNWYQLTLDLKNNSHPYYFIKERETKYLLPAFILTGRLFRATYYSLIRKL